MTAWARRCAVPVANLCAWNRAFAHPTRLRADRGLQRLQLLELECELVALPILRGVGDILLGVLDLAGQLGMIEIVERHGLVGKHGQSLRIDLGKAAVDHDLELPALTKKRQDAWPHRGHKRRMAGEHAEVALRARHVDLIDVAREQKLLGRDEIEVESCHWDSVRPARVNGEWRVADYRSTIPARFSFFAIRRSLFALFTPPPPPASCPSRSPPRWCRPCRRRPPAGDRICLRPAP